MPVSRDPSYLGSVSICNLLYLPRILGKPDLRYLSEADNQYVRKQLRCYAAGRLLPLNLALLEILLAIFEINRGTKFVFKLHNFPHPHE